MVEASRCTCFSCMRTRCNVVDVQMHRVRRATSLRTMKRSMSGVNFHGLRPQFWYLYARRPSFAEKAL